MSIVIKTADEIEKMRAAGKLAASVLEMIAPHVKAGVSTNELNDICAKYTEEQGAILRRSTTMVFPSPSVPLSMR